MVYLKSVENVITLGKLIGLLLLFCLPLLSILFLKTKRNDLAHPVMGTIFLVGERARHSQVCSIENRGYIYYWASEASPTLGCSIEISRMLSVCRMSVVCQINCVGRITWPTRMLKVFWGRLNQ